MTQPLQYDQASFVISLFSINFFFLFWLSHFSGIFWCFYLEPEFLVFSSKEFHSYTPCFIFCSLEQLLNWRRNLHEIIHIKRQGFLVGKTTVESISSAKFIAMYAWSHMHDGYLIDWIYNTSECPMEKALKGCFELSATSDPLTWIPGHMPLYILYDKVNLSHLFSQFTALDLLIWIWGATEVNCLCSELKWRACWSVLLVRRFDLCWMLCHGC